MVIPVFAETIVAYLLQYKIVLPSDFSCMSGIRALRSQHGYNIYKVNLHALF